MNACEIYIAGKALDLLNQFSIFVVMLTRIWVHLARHSDPHSFE
jgi:hypothetical protein